MILLYRRYKLRKEVGETLKHFRHVWNMRRDVMGAEELGALEAKIAELKAARKGGDIAAMEKALEGAQELNRQVNPLRRFPAMRELVDTLVVAFGVAMAFRAYCYQPFKIPTNSMLPTLYGRHSVEVAADFKPSWLDQDPFRWAKWLATGEMYREIVAVGGGGVEVLQDNARAPGEVIVRVRGVRYKVPRDAWDRGEIRVPKHQAGGFADAGGRMVELLGSRTAGRGELIWKGFVRSGDQVFVNRMKWYFFPPQRGETIVFMTDGIPHLDPGTFYIKRLVGLPGETISIDAMPLVVDGEYITYAPHPLVDGVCIIDASHRVVDGKCILNASYLMVNGERVMKPETILRVAEKRLAWSEEPTYLGFESSLLTAILGRSRVHSPYYLGYVYGGAAFLSSQTRRWEGSFLGVFGDEKTLGSDEFLAMGDNTFNSLDSRYWGPVPQRKLVGPASVIYWPPSPRWGRVQ